MSVVEAQIIHSIYLSAALHVRDCQSVSQSVFINEDIYRINKLTTTDKALYRFYVADKSVPPIYLRELS